MQNTKHLEESNRFSCSSHRCQKQVTASDAMHKAPKVEENFPWSIHCDQNRAIKLHGVLKTFRRAQIVPHSVPKHPKGDNFPCSNHRIHKRAIEPHAKTKTFRSGL